MPNTGIRIYKKRALSKRYFIENVTVIISGILFILKTTNDLYIQIWFIILSLSYVWGSVGCLGWMVLLPWLRENWDPPHQGRQDWTDTDCLQTSRKRLHRHQCVQPYPADPMSAGEKSSKLENKSSFILQSLFYCFNVVHVHSN